MIYFALMFLLVLGTAGAFGYGWHERRKQKALAPSAEDERIILALKEGTLTDADLEDIGMDPEAFRAKHGLGPSRQEVVELAARANAAFRAAPGLPAHRQYLPPERQNDPGPPFP